MRGIRGAITVEENTAEAVMSATQEVVRAMLEKWGVLNVENRPSR